jgi:hypothetical protein
VLTEWWDDIQLRSVVAEGGTGGNKNFYDFMHYYKLMDDTSSVEPEKRFKHSSIKYYIRKLQARIDEQPFSER